MLNWFKGYHDSTIGSVLAMLRMDGDNPRIEIIAQHREATLQMTVQLHPETSVEKALELLNVVDIGAACRDTLVPAYAKVDAGDTSDCGVPQPVGDLTLSFGGVSDAAPNVSAVD